MEIKLFNAHQVVQHVHRGPLGVVALGVVEDLPGVEENVDSSLEYAHQVVRKIELPEHREGIPYQETVVRVILYDAQHHLYHFHPGCHIEILGTFSLLIDDHL